MIDPTRGITLGKPVALVSSGTRVVGLLVTNSTDLVKTFTVRATYKDGERIVATADGVVNDLLPGQTRAAMLLGTDPIPRTTDAVRIDLNTLLAEGPTTPGGTVAGRIRFGPPTVNGAPLPRVDVEVRNDDQASHSFTAQAALVRGDQLLGVGVGAVNDLAPGQTKTATLLVQGTSDGYERVLLAVETVLH